jgi:hypothetical protein
VQGWEPESRTEYEYGPSGVLVAAVTTREPEFGQDDVDWFLALHELEAEEMPHGFSYTEATSLEADPDNRDGSYRFVAGIPMQSPEGDWVRVGVTDFAEKARLDRLAAMRGHDPDPLAGVHMPVFRVPRTPRAPRKRRRRATPPQQ